MVILPHLKQEVKAGRLLTQISNTFGSLQQPQALIRATRPIILHDRFQRVILAAEIIRLRVVSFTC